jgi:hypothetical protein
VKQVVVTAVVEGDADVPIVERVVEHAGATVGTAYVQRGKDRLDANLAGYNNAARHAHWLVLRDLNGEPCAPGLIERLLPHPAFLMRLRIAVRSAEAWLLADRDEIADFLSVRQARIPITPDDIPDAKQFLVNLAQQSRDRRIRQDMVPRAGTTARVGPGYTGRIVEFAIEHWRPEIAMASSPSLRRCIAAVASLVATPFPAINDP